MAAKTPGPVIVGDLSARVLPARGCRDGRWYWRCEPRRDGRKVTLWCGWATPREALDAMKDVESGETPQTPGSSECVTVRDLLELWGPPLLKRTGVTQTTRSRARFRANHTASAAYPVSTRSQSRSDPSCPPQKALSA